LLKVEGVHDVYVTDEHVVVGLKTNAAVNEAAIRAVLRKNQSASLFPVVVPAEPAA